MTGGDWLRAFVTAFRDASALDAARDDSVQLAHTVTALMERLTEVEQQRDDWAVVAGVRQGTIEALTAKLGTANALLAVVEPGS